MNKSALKRINAVEGYDPAAELVSYPLCDENGVEIGTRTRLPLKVKREWFRLCHPVGLVYTAIRKEGVEDGRFWAEAECRVLPDYREKEFFLSAAVQTASERPNPAYDRLTGPEIRSAVRNMAKAKAESMALSLAGFGFQIETSDEIAAAADEDVKEADQAYAAAPKATVPKVTPPTRTAKARKAEAKAERLAREKEALAAMSADAAEPMPEAAPAPAPEPEFDVSEPEPELDASEPDIDVSEPELEEAKAYLYTKPDGTKIGLGSAVPRFILWLWQNSPAGSESRKMAEVLIRHDPAVRAAAEREGMF